MRALVCWLVLLCFVPRLRSQGSDLAAKGLSLQQHGDLDRAARDYEAALHADPNQVAVWTNLGVIRVQQGQFPAAIGAYRHALKIDSAFAPARLNLALAYYKDGDLDQARQQIQTYRHGQGDDLRSAMLLADCDLRLGNNAEVIALMTPWAQKDPESLAIAYLLGTADIRAGKTAEGQQYIQQIMSHGDRAEVHMMMGDAYSHAHELKNAVAEFARAVALNPQLPQAHERLAEADLMTGDSDSALQQFQIEYKNNPNSFETSFYLGFLYKKHGSLEQARPYLERAHAMRPDAVEPVLQLGLLSYEVGQLPQARQWLEQVVKKAPKTIQAHVVLGQIYYRLHMPAQGLQERKTVQALNEERQQESIRHREQVSEHLDAVAGKGDHQP